MSNKRMNEIKPPWLVSFHWGRDHPTKKHRVMLVTSCYVLKWNLLRGLTAVLAQWRLWDSGPPTKNRDPEHAALVVGGKLNYKASVFGGFLLASGV